MPRVDTSDATDPYLAVLDQVLADRFLSADENAGLAALATNRGLSSVEAAWKQRGSSVARWAPGADGRGSLLTGDTIAIGADRKSVNVRRSYVNQIPLPERAVRRILAAVAPYYYHRISGALGNIEADAKPIVTTSLERYLA